MRILFPERRLRSARYTQTNLGSLIAALYDAAAEMTDSRDERDSLVAAALRDLVVDRRHPDEAMPKAVYAA